MSLHIGFSILWQDLEQKASQMLSFEHHKKRHNRYKHPLSHRTPHISYDGYPSARDIGQLIGYECLYRSGIFFDHRKELFYTDTTDDEFEHCFKVRMESKSFDAISMERVLYARNPGRQGSDTFADVLYKYR